MSVLVHIRNGPYLLNVVAAVHVPLDAEGEPPEGVRYGDRFFVRIHYAPSDPDGIPGYREVTAYHVTES